MSMDYTPMWRIVDAHRRCADELEQTIREISGDRPAPPSADRVTEFSELADLLVAVRRQLDHVAEREGRSIRRVDASRCRVFAGRCERALDMLWKAGEL